jgi:maleylpyruvate isomerase
MPDQALSAPRQKLDWLRAGTMLFTARLDALSDADLDAPTRLPGWTRRHVVSHVAYNARALMRLVHWARTGEQSRMYASREARDAEIEDGTRFTPAELRALARGSADELWSALDGLSGAQWGAEVLTAQGRSVPATEIPWMRCREVWIHSVDLDAGTRFADFPPELVDALLDDLTALRQRGEQEPALVLAPDDRQRTWTIELAARPATKVTGEAASMAAWLTGRGDAGVHADAGAALPTLGRWL